MNEFSLNKPKKSKWGLRKTKINLYQKVATLTKTKNLVFKNIFPLVIMLNKDQEVALTELMLDNLSGNSHFIEEMISYYYSPTFIGDGEFITYWYLDINKIEKKFFENKIYIEQFIYLNGMVKYVYSMYCSTNNTSAINSTRIGLISKRKLYIDKKDIEIVDISNFITNFINDYEIQQQKIRQLQQQKIRNMNLSQEEIDGIHGRGNLTPSEIVKEWESYGLCVPGDAIGSAKNRCHEFGNCHDCLTDYAYNHSEYTPIFKEFKIVNSIFESQSQVDEKKGQVLTRKR